jgi:hypothetical protein
MITRTSRKASMWARKALLLAAPVLLYAISRRSAWKGNSLKFESELLSRGPAKAGPSSIPEEDHPLPRHHV